MSSISIKDQFVSSIKVKGLHLLPPVITDSRRLELQKDKQQAIKLERRLQNCKELKKNLEELLTIHNLTDSPSYIGGAHVEDVRIICSNNGSQSKRKPSLSTDVVDITEYNNRGIKLISKDSVFESKQGQTEFKEGHQLYSNSYSNSSDAYDTDSSLYKSSEIPVSLISSDARHQNYHCPLNTTEDIEIKDSPYQSKNTLNCNRTKPNSAKSPVSPKNRLIRSNSYTLETPSPILLAHLEKWSKENCSNNLQPVQTHLNLSRTWTSLENNFVPLEDSEFSSLNTVYNTGLMDKDNGTEVCLSEISSEEMQPQKEVTEESAPTIEVVQTDISVQQITVNANSDDIQSVKNTINLSDPNCQLMQVLKKIPENYSKQIIELIEKQKADYCSKVDSFEKQFYSSKHSDSLPEKDSLQDIDSNYCNAPDSDHLVRNEKFLKFVEAQNGVNVELKKTKSHTPDNISESNAQHLSQTNIHQDRSPEVYRSPSLLCFDYGNDDTVGINCNPPFGAEYNERKDKYIVSERRTAEDIKKEWAANIICANVKGYLTRRLLKTTRVQSLIDTIRDALVCALQLHEVEHIDEADVELHRRLINQVSAACYAFHDIFFALSVSDKMALISTDRKRLIEKKRKPSSTPNIHRSLSNSSRSSTKSFHSQSQSLMKT